MKLRNKCNIRAGALQKRKTTITKKKKKNTHTHTHTQITLLHVLQALYISIVFAVRVKTLSVFDFPL